MTPRATIDRAAHFYGATLGLPQIYRFPQNGTPEHVEFSVGSAVIAVSSPAGLKAHGMPEATPGHPFEIAIKTDDLDIAIAQLKAAGVTVLKEPATSAAGNRYACIADPDGTWISLYQNIPTPGNP